MKITLEIERIGSVGQIGDPWYECNAEIEHDITRWKASGTSVGETLLNLIEMIRPTIAQRLPR